MNESTSTESHGEEAWLRHYVWAAQQRQKAASARKRLAHLGYRRRELRFAYAIATVLVGLLALAWRAF
jgi:hypothetical protein